MSIIPQYYAPVSDATGRPAYPGLLLFKMLLVGLWHGGLSDESAEDVANANLHDGQPMLALLDKAGIEPSCRLYADKAYDSQKHREALKAQGIKNGIQDKAVKNKPLTTRQLQRNRLITRLRYVVERTFGSQARWFGGKILRYRGLAKAHAWHVLQAMAYNLKRLSKLFIESLMSQEKCVF